MNTSTHFLHAHGIIEMLVAKGHVAFLAGGCVRDELLGRPPKDYDVATSATPEQIKVLFKDCHKVILVGEKFGVIRIKVTPDSPETEVATFRTDGDYTDGRRPDKVRLTDAWREDVTRRDFTINGMMKDLVIVPQILDIVGGQQDIRDKIIRCIGDPKKRFEEDYLRMLRAVRFACQLNFHIDEETSEAIYANAVKIQAIAMERRRDELFKIMTSGQVGYGFYLMLKTGLLRYGFAELYDNIDATSYSLLCRMNANDDPLLGMVTILKETTEPAQRYRLSSADGYRLADAISIHRELKRFTTMAEVDRRKLARRPGWNLAIRYLELGEKILAEYPIDSIQVWAGQLTEEDLHRKPLLNGTDLLELGITNGKQFPYIFNAVEDARLKGWVTTKEQAIIFVHGLKTNAPGMETDVNFTRDSSQPRAMQNDPL